MTTPRERAISRRWPTSSGSPTTAHHRGLGRLSLRAIARELGLVSSAIYRYVPSRDELLTLLIESRTTPTVTAPPWRQPKRGAAGTTLAAAG